MTAEGKVVPNKYVPISGISRKCIHNLYDYHFSLIYTKCITSLPQMYEIIAVPVDSVPAIVSYWLTNFSKHLIGIATHLYSIVAPKLFSVVGSLAKAFFSIAKWSVSIRSAKRAGYFIRSPSYLFERFLSGYFLHHNDGAQVAHPVESDIHTQSSSSSSYRRNKTDFWSKLDQLTPVAILVNKKKKKVWINLCLRCRTVLWVFTVIIMSINYILV